MISSNRIIISLKRYLNSDLGFLGYFVKLSIIGNNSLVFKRYNFIYKSLTNMQGFKFVSNSSAKAVSIMLNSTLEKVDFNLYPLKNYRCNMTTETKRITHRVGHLF